MLVDSIYLFPIDATYQYLDCMDIDIPNRIRAKALRFYRISDQNNYLAARWILYTLTQQAGINIPLGDFEIGANGKPFISGFSSFNISHCNGMVAVALSDGAIGIDVEHIDASRSLDHFRGVFSPQEINAIESNGANAFYHFWTIKEAVLKCTGEGMATLSILQQINQKDHHLVTHQNQDFFYKSFKVNQSKILSIVTPTDYSDTHSIKTFKCSISINNTLLIEEDDSLLFPIHFSQLSPSVH